MKEEVIHLEEKIIEIETSKLAKEKGFQQHRGDYFYTEKYGLCSLGEDGEFLRVEKYPKTGKFQVLYDVNGEFEHGEWFYAPTQALLQKWLRERHNILLYNLPNTTFTGWYYQITLPRDNNCICDFRLDQLFTYEEALEVGLQEALKLIING